MTTHPQTQEKGDDEIELAHLLELVAKGKWFIAAAALLAVLIGALYVHNATPIYRGDTLLQVEREKGSMAGLGEVYLDGQTPTSAELELLRSRMVVGTVVDELDLTLRAEPEPCSLWRRITGAGEQRESFWVHIVGGGLWRGLTGSDNARAIEVGRLEVADRLIGTPLRLTLLEDKRYQVTEADSGRVLGFGRVDEPAQLSPVGGNSEVALFVGQIEGSPGDTFIVERRPRISAINGIRGAMNVRERGGDSGILEVTLEHPDRGYIQEVLNALGQAYVRQNVERRSQEAQRSLDFLNEQLPELRTQVQDAEDAFNEFRREHRALDLDEEARQLLNRYVEVDSELQQTRFQLSEQSQTYGTDHPRMENLRNRRQQLQQVRAELDDELGQIPEQQQQMLRLRREMQVSTDLYTSLLNTAQELRIAQAGTVGNVRIVDEAVAGGRVHPKPTQTLAFSLALGIALGIGGVLTREFFRRGIADPDAIEQRLGYPCYAVIPHSRTQRRYERNTNRKNVAMGLLARDEGQEMAAESIRSLRTSLHFALMGDAGNVISMTSPGAENGKTFLSMNLAWLAAESGQRVLVVDADLRRGHVHRYLEERHEQRAPGLAEVLAGRCAFRDALVSVDGARLDVITSGTLPPNPSELLMRPRFEQFIQGAARHYDLVIMDSAPILAVTDGVIAAAQAGAVLMVLRANITTEREARAAIRRLDQNGIRPTGLVVNDFNARRESYGQYYYEYSYRSERPKASRPRSEPRKGSGRGPGKGPSKWWPPGWGAARPARR